MHRRLIDRKVIDVLRLLESDLGGPDIARELSVSVNLSLKSLDHVHLAERATELVHSEGVDPAHMILEVTESATSIDVGHALEKLRTKIA